MDVKGFSTLILDSLFAHHNDRAGIKESALPQPLLIDLLFLEGVGFYLHLREKREMSRNEMTIELIMLALSIILGLFHILLSAHTASLQVGYRWTATAKEARPPLTGIAGRLERALRNFLETFPFFASAVLIAHLTQHHNRLTILGSEMYFIARVVYLPLYAFGIPLIRSLVWNVATIGIGLILLSLIV